MQVVARLYMRFIKLDGGGKDILNWLPDTYLKVGESIYGGIDKKHAPALWTTPEKQSLMLLWIAKIELEALSFPQLYFMVLK